MFPLGGFGYAIPRCQRSLPLAMGRASLSNPLTANDSHTLSSHIAKLVASEFLPQLRRGQLDPREIDRLRGEGKFDQCFCSVSVSTRASAWLRRATRGFSGWKSDLNKG